MSVSTVEFLSKERAERLAARVKAFESDGQQYKLRERRSPISGSLDPFQGEWTPRLARHLLSRCLWGATPEQIEMAANSTMADMVDMLCTDTALPDPPVNYFDEDDPFTAIGETWVDKPEPQETVGPRVSSLFGWTTGNLLNRDVSVTEKMTLFWHNHFVTSDMNSPKLGYRYITLLRQNALGNFKKLAKDVTIDPAMLIYLNGIQNTQFAPNENYARELLELFTLGKGPQVGPGDYTTFTEQDVQAISRVLTGWRARLDDSGANVNVFFSQFFHDTEPKVLSERLGGVTVEPNGEQEYKDLIDVIFEQAEASRFICRKLYRWFVYYEIDEAIELNVIEPMAQILRDNDFEIKPVLKALLSSEHFYDENSIGCIIRNPIEYVVGLINQFELPMPDDLPQRYALWNGIFRFTELLQMIYFFPPSVAGWKAFYQEPAYNQLWINSVTLVVRQLWTDVMSTTGFESFDGRFQIDVFRFVDQVDDPLDPNALIRSFALLLLPNDLSQEQIDILKEVLIPGLPDFEWTIEYQRYLNDPENEELKAGVESRLRALLRTMLARPEYHLG